MTKAMKHLLYAFIIVSIFSCGTNKTQEKDTNGEDFNVNYGKYLEESGKPQKFDRDLVPDEKTAIRLADAIWDARYGIKKGTRDLPYTIKLEKGVWYIKTNLPEGYYGKVFNIKINKYDGKVLYIWSEG